VNEYLTENCLKFSIKSVQYEAVWSFEIRALLAGVEVFTLESKNTG